MGDFIEADFIGGIWDGKTYAIPVVPEWRVAVLPPFNCVVSEAEEASNGFTGYDVAVYRNIGHGIFWLSRTEKR